MDERLIRVEPFLEKNDPLPAVKNVMNASHLFELPVVSEGRVVGTVTAKGVVEVLSRHRCDPEALTAAHVMEEDVQKGDVATPEEEVVRRLVESGRLIFCFEKEGTFAGYTTRRMLLALVGEEESVEGFVTADYVEVDADADLKELVDLVREGKPLLVRKDGKPFSAYLPEELYFLIFVEDFLLKRFETDFETLRGEERKWLGKRLERRLLSGEEHRHTLPLVRVGDVAEEFKVRRDATVREVASMLARERRFCVAVEDGGIVRDVDLLRTVVG